MIKSFSKYLADTVGIKNPHRILLALSGGSDSMVMADLFIKAGADIGIAHCNFQMRGKDSEGDEEFVREFAQTNGIPIYIKKFETKSHSSEKGISIQMAARELRYEWFHQICRDENYQKIATAHHQNDNLETVSLNFIKGTGIDGLTGISINKNQIIRPLLPISKKWILDYATEHKIKYRTDLSNLDNKYERNKIRNELIPVMESINPGLTGTFEQTLGNIQFADILFKERLEYYKKRLLMFREPDIYIPLYRLWTYPDPPRLLFAIIKEYGFNLDQISGLIDSSQNIPGKMILSKEWRLIRDRRFLILTSQKASGSGYIYIDRDSKKMELKDFILKLKVIKVDNYQIRKKPGIAALDLDLLNFPLLMRRWKASDYFYPIGLNKEGSDKRGKKKLSDYFIDQKLPITEKERQYVVLSGERIVWVAGMRLDDRFKITPKTKTVFEISFAINK